MGAYVWPVDNWQAADTSKYTGRRLRQLLGALTSGKTAARPLGARSGVMVGTPSNTVTATSTACTVNPHSGVIDAQTLAIAGPYFYSIDAAVTKTVPAADASLARVDLVAVQISDPTEADGTSTPGVDVVYVPGTPGAGTPATPARSLVLAVVNVPKLNGGAPSVTWAATYTVAAGGIVPASSGAQYPPSPYVGQFVDDAALGLRRWDGSSWKGPQADTGWLNLSLLSGYTTPDVAQVRMEGGRVEFQGQVSRTAGAFPSTTTQFATLPAAIGLPTRSHRWATAGFASVSRPNLMLVLMSAGSGAVSAAGVAGAAADVNSSVYLDGMSYRID